MRLNKTTSHAIRILIACAKAEDNLVKTATLAAQLALSPLNVFKIVNLLSRAGFLQAQRGRNGGVRLARPATEIRIGEIVRVIEAPDVAVTDGSKTPKSRRNSAEINVVFDAALEAFISVLDQHTVADMARDRPAEALPARPATKGRRPASKAHAAAAFIMRGLPTS